MDTVRHSCISVYSIFFKCCDTSAISVLLSVQEMILGEKKVYGITEDKRKCKEVWGLTLAF